MVVDQVMVETADWSLPLLARLTSTVELSTVLTWMQRQRAGVPPARLFGGGLAGTVAGLAHAAAFEPRLTEIAGRARDRLVEWSARQTPPPRIRSVDYDIVSGMAGVVLALAVSPGCRREHLEPAVGYLRGLGLEGFRLGQGHLNYGVAHGIPGVLSAFVSAGRLADTSAEIELLTGHLIEASFVDDRGVTTWGWGDLDEARGGQRQAWCYGTPGVAWQIADAGRLLGRPDWVEFARDAMRSLMDAWDDDYYLDDGPQAFCHGIPGIIAAADALDVPHQLELRIVPGRLTMLDGWGGSYAVALGWRAFHSR